MASESKVFSFSFHRDHDRDLIEWLEGLPRNVASATVRTVLRAHLRREDKVERMVEEIWEKVVRGGLAMQVPDAIVSADAGLDRETTNNLKGLGL
jgi:hypothetical protein